MRTEIIEQKGHLFLWLDDKLWMWDIPAERQIQKEIADQAYGKVLVVGYGLGIVQGYLQENDAVSCFETAEINADVLRVCRERFGRLSGHVFCSDFYTIELIDEDERYDCVIGDIWQEIHLKFLPEYVKFKAHAMTLLKSKGKILAWGKEYFEWLLTQ